MSNSQNGMIGVVGRSGNGKSSCFRNLDQSKVLYFNLEGKDLPFNHNVLKETPGRLFTLNWPPADQVNNFDFYEAELKRFWAALSYYSPKEVLTNPNRKPDEKAIYKTIDRLAENKEEGKSKIEFIVADSISEYAQFVLRWAQLKNPSPKDFYVVWKDYNEKIGDFLNCFKNFSKHCIVVVTAHDEYVYLNGEPTKQKVMYVKGKEWEGKMESKFTHILYAVKTETENDEVDFQLNIRPNATNSTKVPLGIQEVLQKVFDDDKLKNIPNDITLYFTALETFHKS